MRFQKPIFNSFLNHETNTSWRDLFLLILLILLLWLGIIAIKGMNFPLDEFQNHSINLDPKNIPYYMFRSTFRMFTAYFASLIFTFFISYIAYKNKSLGSFIIPIVDILQSVPVLGFLSISVTLFMGIFPKSLMGVEMASLFAIFTGQAWNMTLGFYHSLITIPNDLEEVSLNYKLSSWKKFKTLEFPNGVISLVWNSMMSFGGGWFFVVQSEMITVLNKNIKLPGIGSYLGTALENGDQRSAVYAIFAMLFTIIFIDQILFKTAIAWSQNFKIELVESEQVNKSWFYDLLTKSYLAEKLSNLFIHLLDLIFDNKFVQRRKRYRKTLSMKWLNYLLIIVGIISLIVLSNIFYKNFSIIEFKHIAYLGLLTMLRIFLMLIVATLIWTPIGVLIGLNANLAKYVRPFTQIGASFPINMLFPFLIGFFIRNNIDINWGSILLMALGSQWYILFNVIAGASSIPSDLLESSKVFKLKSFARWKKLIIPAIFPYWVTGACTAAGGAWNASIVAEFAFFGKDKLIAKGLGAYITEVTNNGQWNNIFLSITMMSLFVIVINQLVWKKLYKLAETKFHIE